MPVVHPGGASTGFEFCRKGERARKQRQKHKEKERKALTWPGVTQVQGARTLRAVSDTQRARRARLGRGGLIPTGGAGLQSACRAIYRFFFLFAGLRVDL